MIAIGNIRKMKSRLTQPVTYFLPLFDNLEMGTSVSMNALIGKRIRISFLEVINCVVTGKTINKTYGEGMSYEAYMTSPLAVESIFHPELSLAHLGKGLRDVEWETKHDMQPHFVYLTLTNKVKVGVTRESNFPYRWIDQGAWKAIVFAKTPYRQLAGEIEVALKQHVSDKTSWQRMLINERSEEDLIEEKERLIKLLPETLNSYISDKNEVVEIHYPVISYPDKVKSLKLNRTPEIIKRLNGIRGQYLMFDDGTVFNVRSHAGYKIELEW